MENILACIALKRKLCYNRCNMKKKIIKKIKLYSVSLTILGVETKIKADTLLEAFDMIKPEMVKGKAIMVVNKGKLKAEMVFYPFQLKRLMNNKYFKMLIEKRLNQRLN